MIPQNAKSMETYFKLKKQQKKEANLFGTMLFRLFNIIIINIICIVTIIFCHCVEMTAISQ